MKIFLKAGSAIYNFDNIMAIHATTSGGRPVVEIMLTDKYNSVVNCSNPEKAIASIMECISYESTHVNCDGVVPNVIIVDLEEIIKEC